MRCCPRLRTGGLWSSYCCRARVTLVPLIVIMISQKHIDLVSIGLINYVSPVMQLLFGIYIFREPMPVPLRVTLACTVLALFLFTLGQIKKFQTAKI